MNIGNRSTVRAILMLLGVAGAWLSGCSGAVQSSTEVENEIAARSLQGVAMDSLAIDSASWSAWDASGALIAQGLTDSVGGFSASLVRTPVGGIVVRVAGRGDTLRALVGLDTSVVRSGVATILVNTLTEAAMPRHLTEFSHGFADSLVPQTRRRGQWLMDSVLGVSLPWSAIACDPNFRAVAPSRGSRPSPLSGFLRAVSVRAARDSLGGAGWIVGRQGVRGGVARDTLFAVDLAGSMAVLRLTQDQTTEYVRSLDRASGTQGAWEEAWRSRQILPDPSDRAACLPWAADPTNQWIWQRLVEVTGNMAAEYENGLAPQIRATIKPGRSHDIVAVAVGALIAPDQKSSNPSAKVSLDAFLAWEVPQAFLLLDQLRPEVWGAPPSKEPDGHGSGVGASPESKLLMMAMLSGLPSPWMYGMFQTQPDPAAWLSTNLQPLASPQEAADALDSVLSRHPELKIPPNLLK